MEIKVEKISDLMSKSAAFTILKEDINVNKEKMYRSEHSPCRAVLFKIEMKGIPSFVSVHLTRHSQTGELHFVSSCREDRGFRGVANRNTPVNHMMILNAQHLINISKVRLCTKSHKQTRKVWEEICSRICDVEPELYKYLVPSCIYRGYCPEFKSCGYYEKWKRKQEK